MDQVKIGRFISQMRRERALTQRQLADTLGISDKTVSKWETGNGLPEVALMLPLCGTLGIGVNELLSGEHLTDSDYKKKAEENIMDLVKEREESKKSIILSAAVCLLTILSGVTLIILAGLLDMDTWLRVLLVALAIVIIGGGIAVAAALDMKAGTFECRECGTRFVPTAGAYIAAAHSITTRRLKCPNCGKTTYCKRRLTH